MPPAPTRHQAGLLLPPDVVLGGGAARGSGGRSASWTLAVLWLAWVALLLAAVRPQWLGEPLGILASGRDLILAVDLSASMERRDIRTDDGLVDRLTVVRKMGGQFIEGRVGDRIGLILFGRNAYVQAPLTFDRATVHKLLDEAFIGLAGRETAIGDAVGLAVRSLTGEGRPPQRHQRVLVLLTDGVNSAGSLEPLQAAGLAARHGLQIYTVGVGSESTVGAREFNLESPGSGLDEPMLKQMAEMTGGQYFRAHDAIELDDIYQRLDELEPVATEENRLRPVSELFPWPLALAALLVLYVLSRHSRQFLILRWQRVLDAG